MTDATQIIRADLDPELLPPKPIQTTVLGVTVGNLTAAPALCAVRYVSTCIQQADPLSDLPPIFQTDYHVLNVQTLPADTSMPAIAARVNTIAKRLYLRDARGDYHVLCDASEVGRPVIESIRFSIIPQVHVTGVVITPTDRADASILWRNETTVGLRYLVSRLQAIMQGGRLHLPDDPAMTDLLSLLRGYEVRDDRRPDPVSALALACSAEYTPVRYDASFDELPSAAY